MKGAYFFIAFFLLFTSAVFLISTPMFPGNMLLSIANLATFEYAALLSALINGVTYGLIAWAIFALAMRRMEGTTSKSSVKKQKRRK
jgi:hypothetical protein